MVKRSFAATVSAAFIATWGNPQAIIDVSMMLGASKASLSHTQGIDFIIGFILASGTWFYGLTTLVSIFRSKIGIKTIFGINFLSSLFVMGYGVMLFYKFICLL